MKSFQEWLALKLEAKEQAEKAAKHKLKKVRSKGFGFPRPYFIGTTPDEDDQGGAMDNDDAGGENEPGQGDTD